MPNFSRVWGGFAARPDPQGSAASIVGVEIDGGGVLVCKSTWTFESLVMAKLRPEEKSFFFFFSARREN